jgi:hypothetical protein
MWNEMGQFLFVRAKEVNQEQFTLEGKPAMQYGNTFAREQTIIRLYGLPMWENG